MPHNSEKLRDLVLRKLIEDVQNNPRHWAETILTRLEETNGLIDYLDLGNISKETREEILEELGYDPRENEAPASAGPRFDVVFQDPLPEDQVEKLRLRYLELHGYRIKEWVIGDLTRQMVLNCHWTWLEECLENGASFRITGVHMTTSHLGALAHVICSATRISSPRLHEKIMELQAEDCLDIELIPGK